MPQPMLLDQVRSAIRLRHYSIRTEEAYVNVIRRFILYHQKRHPKEMGADEISQYLSHLATDEKCCRFDAERGARCLALSVP